MYTIIIVHKSRNTSILYNTVIIHKSCNVQMLYRLIADVAVIRIIFQMSSTDMSLQISSFEFLAAFRTCQNPSLREFGIAIRKEANSRLALRLQGFIQTSKSRCRKMQLGRKMHSTCNRQGSFHDLLLDNHSIVIQ